MKYFITGATGFIGGKLALKLARAGHQVNALVRDPEKAHLLKENGISLYKGDLTDKASLMEPMQGADGVFHVAAWYKVGVKDKSQAYNINVEGTRNVLEAMKELRIRKGVYTSTLAVNSDTKGMVVDESYRFIGRHLSEYDRTKWLAHYEVALPMMAQGLPLVVVMPGLVYGPGDTSAGAETFRQYLKGKLPIIPTRTSFCWSHVDDIADAHILAMEKGRAGEPYIIAGPVHTLADALHTAEKITGVRAPRIKVPPGAMKLTASLAGVMEKILPLPEIYSGEVLRVSAGTTYLGSNAKARKELAYDPRPLEDGMRETLAAMMKEMRNSSRR